MTQSDTSCRRSGTVLSALCMAIGIALCVAPLGARAQAGTQTESIIRQYAIPAGSLADALSAFGTQSGKQIVYSPELVKGVSSRGARGAFTAFDALRELLRGSGLKVERLNDTTIVIKKEDAAPKPAIRSQSKDTPVTSAEVIEMDPIVVTGTHIRHAGTLSPVITMTHDDLVKQGYTRVDDAIQQLPQNFKGGGASQDTNGITATGGESAYNQTFSSGVNLRGLGPSATLVLLNGRRLAPTSSGFSTDISQIPVSAIERVEILTDGASAIYGSDAVAGVVNIITKKDYSGFEIGLRANSIAAGKTPNYGASVTGGFEWGGGNLIANFDHEKAKPLFARARSFTDSIPDPVSLFPENEVSNAYASLHQQFGNAFELSSDLFASKRKFQASANAGGLGSTAGLEAISGSAEQLAGAVQLDYAISPEWTATLVGQFARERDHQVIVNPVFDYVYTNEYTYDVPSIETRIEGGLLRLPGGLLRAVFGGSLREARFRSGFEYVTSGGTSLSNADSDRRVSAVYGEILVPIVGEQNAVPLIKQLSFDIAVRYDDYSDFGSTTNPKFSLQWVVTDEVSVHGSYGTSFKAPTLYTMDTNIFYAAYIWDATDPSSPSGTTRALLLDGNNADLTPEEARSWNVGLTFKPDFAPGWQAEVSYFDIDYENRILRLGDNGFFDNVIQDAQLLGPLVNLSPTAAQIDQILNASGRTIYTYVGPYTPDSIEAIANIGWVNAASSRVRGFDATLRYERNTRAGAISVEGTGSYFDEYDNRVTPTSPEFSILNSLYNPMRFRGKVNLGWERERWATNARLNYSSSYTNASDSRCPAPGCPVSSWTTVDLSISYSAPANGNAGFLDGVRIGLDVSNIFDQKPPFVQSVSGLNYDPANANPLMRAIGISLTKSW